MLYKIIENEYIIGIGGTQGIIAGVIEITEAEYNSIMDAIRNKPADTETAAYKLNTELEWVAVEPEPIPEPDPFDNEDYAAGYEQALLDLMELEMAEIEEEA